MQEITNPVIAIVLVISAVFISAAFMGGFGEFMLYQQFAITIIISLLSQGLWHLPSPLHIMCAFPTKT